MTRSKAADGNVELSQPLIVHAGLSLIVGDVGSGESSHTEPVGPILQIIVHGQSDYQGVSALRYAALNSVLTVSVAS